MQCNEVAIIVRQVLALTILRGYRLALHRRRKFALLAQLLTEYVETYRDRDHSSGKAAKQCAGPLNAKIIEHLA
jgi:hypothetical protein